MTKFYYNRTFSRGNNTQLNACVGNNGWTDLNAYSSGYDDAVKIMISAAINDDVAVDSIIYPLVFSARHRIELFIKSIIKDLGEIKTDLALKEEKLIKTHDLDDLWKICKDIFVKCDRRLTEYIHKIEPIILDFSRIDPTGEIFRYPYSQCGKKHLENTPLINIEIFNKSYLELTESLDELRYLVEYLGYEYSQGTFTKNLSRDEIKFISTVLPNKSTWADKEFTEAKEKIKDKFGLSNRSFSEAVNLILSHREFSINIGIETPLKHLDVDSLDLFLAEYHRLMCEWEKIENVLDPKLREIDSHFFHFMKKNHSHEVIADLCTLLRHGDSCDYFSEEYERIFKCNLFDNIDDLISELCGNPLVYRYFERSLRKLGQPLLLSVVKKYT